MPKPRRRSWKVTVEIIGGVKYFRIINLSHIKKIFNVDFSDNTQRRGLQPIIQWVLDVAIQDTVKDLELKSPKDISTVTLEKVTP